ncbi:MAG: biopolymer transporter ExbD [Myxococcaceae bacterium]|nr:biopolymer transporter ExbD [Myxococcaceae bacterium]
MAMAAGGSKGGVKSDINVTPLVDVVLVLLIIFMVVTPMLQRGKDVRLPKAENITKEKEGAASDPIILSVTPDKKMWVESDAYPDEAGLEARLKDVFTKEPGRRVLLKGDDSLSFEDVRKVMKVANTAGAKTVALGVEELKQ